MALSMGHMTKLKVINLRLRLVRRRKINRRVREAMGMREGNSKNILHIYEIITDQRKKLE